MICEQHVVFLSYSPQFLYDEPPPPWHFFDPLTRIISNLITRLHL